MFSILILGLKQSILVQCGEDNMFNVHISVYSVIAHMPFVYLKSNVHWLFLYGLNQIGKRREAIPEVMNLHEQ